MSALESMIATSGEAPMLNSLDYTLVPISTAVVDRRQHVRAYPTSASTLTPGGTRTCRLRLGGGDFVDSSSIRLVYTINETANTTGKALKPVAGPWGAFGQCFLRSNGVELDNIPYLGRHMQMHGWNMLSQSEQFGEAGLCGLAGSWATTTQPTNQPQWGSIPNGGSYTVSHKLPLSLFQSGKLLPTRYAPLELELTISNTPGDWLDTASTFSTSYSISNIQLLYDSYLADESIQERSEGRRILRIS